ncbi:MAG TPA: serine hydrolase domain-containing protein [Vicinamibacterales bacterium]|nr:serine hydrolase domain-containing protein [Vicinamibacterales bacterium]
MRRHLLPSPTLAAIAFAVLVNASGQMRTDSGLDRIEALIQGHVDNHTLPGAVLLLAHDGKVAALRAFGAADVESGQPMRTDTLFRLASATKIVTTVGLLTLVDEGRVSLDDPVGKFLPEFRSLRVQDSDGSVRPATSPLTIRDLLRHTSGFGYGGNDRQRAAYQAAGLIRPGTDADWSHHFSLREWTAQLASVPLTAEPGARFEYGLGADIAGALIERVSGRPLDRFLRDRVFAPLGMADTTFVVDPSQARRLASVYRIDGRSFSRVEDGAHSAFRRRPRAFSGGGGWNMLGAGGLVTSAPDFFRFLQTLLDGGAHGSVRILARGTAELLFRNQLANTPTPERAPGLGFGFGYTVVTDPGRYGTPDTEGLMWWAGSLNTRYWLDPSRRLVGLYFTQVEPFPYLDLMNAVMRMSLETVERQPARDLGVSDLDPRGVETSVVVYEGRRAIRVIEANAARAGGIAVLNGVAMRDGTIEIDVAGRRGPYAKDDDRGFIGVAFRVAADRGRYEYIYVRPDNARADDQLRRNHSTQYASYPDFPWPRLRQESPGKYESYVDLQSGAWTRLRIEVAGATARLFVGGADQPALVVADMKLAPASGGVGLWIGAGTEGFFGTPRITKLNGK